MLQRPPRATRPGPRRLRAYRLVCGLIDLVLCLLVRRREEVGRLPEGPLLVAPNHLAAVDPLLVAGYLQRCGRTPRFVTTSGVFDVIGVGAVLRYFDHLPLTRGTREGAVVEAQLAAVADALRRGECVVLYPEGGVTTRDDAMPMAPKPGVARLAALTGAPVLPLGQWGAHEAAGRRRRYLRAVPPRRPVHRVAQGEPLHVPAGASPRDLVAVTRELGARTRAVVERLAAEHAADPRSSAR